MALSIGTVTTVAGYRTTTTISHNNNGDYLLVFVNGAYDGGATVSSVTFNGTSLTQIASVSDGGGYSRDQSAWRLINPSSGTFNVAVTFSSDYIRRVISVISVSGVDQTTPEGTVVTSSGGSGVNPSITVTSATGEIVIDCVNMLYASGDTTITANAGQTELGNMESATGTLANRGGFSYESGASSVTMGWTRSVGNAWSMIGVPVKPTATSGFTATPLIHMMAQAGGLM